MALARRTMGEGKRRSGAEAGSGAEGKRWRGAAALVPAARWAPSPPFPYPQGAPAARRPGESEGPRPPEARPCQARLGREEQSRLPAVPAVWGGHRRAAGFLKTALGRGRSGWAVSPGFLGTQRSFSTPSTVPIKKRKEIHLGVASLGRRGMSVLGQVSLKLLSEGSFPLVIAGHQCS